MANSTVYVLLLTQYKEHYFKQTRCPNHEQLWKVSCVFYNFLTSISLSKSLVVQCTVSVKLRTRYVHITGWVFDRNKPGHMCGIYLQCGRKHDSSILLIFHPLKKVILGTEYVKIVAIIYFSDPKQKNCVDVWI